MTIDDQHTCILAVGILLSAIVILMVGECANKGDDTTTETSSPLIYSTPKGVNCAEKKQGARPACWKSHDWDSYCRNTGNCRSSR